MPLISVIVNVDSRPENDNNQEMFKGCVSRDFLIEGLINKRQLFNGFDFELICFLDEHEPVDESTIAGMRLLCDTLIIRKHNKKFEGQDDFAGFNDLNYIQAISQARGKYIFKFDGDVAAFTSSKEPIQEYIDLLEKYDYVSYPSMWSPEPVHDESFQGKYWASTRFFCCKRTTFDITELIKCQIDFEYWKETYPMARLCHWLEHTTASIAWNKGKGVYYPPVDFGRIIIYTWGTYSKYTLRRLNNQTFEEVRDWVYRQNYHYPNDITIIN